MNDLIKDIYMRDDSKKLINDIFNLIELYHLKYYKKYILKLMDSISLNEFRIFHNKAISNKTARTFEKFLIKYFHKFNIHFISKFDYNKSKNKEQKEVVNKRVKKFRQKNTNLKSLQIMVEPNIKYIFDIVKKENNITSQELLKYLLKNANFLK